MSASTDDASHVSRPSDCRRRICIRCRDARASASNMRFARSLECLKIAHRMLSESRHAQALPPGLIWRLSQDLGVPNERPMLVRGNVDRSLPPTK